MLQRGPHAVGRPLRTKRQALFSEAEELQIAAQAASSDSTYEGK